MTANPVRARRISTGKVGHHCVKISRGCANCYAEVLDGRFGTQLPYVARSEQDIEMFVDDAVLHRMIKLRKPQKIFACDMTDLFQDIVTYEQIDRVFAGLLLAGRHIKQILTKRAERMRDYFAADRMKEIQQHMRALSPRNPFTSVPPETPFPNVWQGVSVEDRASAAERIPLLRETPAVIRFLSIEPLLEDLGELDLDGIDWVIVGGESGPRARPMHMDWVRPIRDQCVAAGVPMLFKQWGDYAPLGLVSGLDPDHFYPGRGHRESVQSGVPMDEPTSMFRVGKKVAGRLLDGRTWDEMPEVGR